MSILNLLSKMKPSKKKYKTLQVQTPNEIRESINKMKRCIKCHFIIFENYWSCQTENQKIVCPTCGVNLSLNHLEKEIKLFQ